MKVNECMTREVRVISPEQSIQQAAQLMAELDIGALPVGEDDRLKGMITDRDIAVRAVAQGLPAETPIRKIMTQDIRYVFEDEELEHVAQTMADQQVRRVPVLSREKRLVGILALGDLAQNRQNQQCAADALSGISREGGQHTQSSRHH